MDFDLTDEQDLLRDVTREVLTRNYDVETRLKVIDTELGWSRDVWSQLAEIGILGLGFDPEEAGQIELMVVLTEIGRRLAPEPVAQAALIPGGLIAELGDDRQRKLLDDVAEGRTLLALAHQEPGMRGLSTRVTTRAERQGDSWTVTGREEPGALRRLRRRVRRQRGAARRAVASGCSSSTPMRSSRRAFRTFDGQRGGAARPGLRRRADRSAPAATRRRACRTR